jgi:hypothetical protein
MTVYVRELRYPGRALLGRVASPNPWFSLTADTEDELRAFAARLGVRWNPGYTVGPLSIILTMGERDRAVALGAQPTKDESKLFHSKSRNRAMTVALWWHEADTGVR